jgi:hypothetical protein
LARHLVTKGKVTGSFSIKRIKRTVRWQLILPAVVLTAVLFKYRRPEDLMLALSFWILAALEAIYWIRVKIQKPAGLVIEGDFLYFNEIQPLKRNLHNFYAINLTGEKNIVELSFKKKSDIVFFTDEFAKKDLEAFINLAIGKSDYDVTIPVGLKYLLDIKEHGIAL